MLNKRAIESLIKGGAFDSVGHPRKGLCLVFEQIVDRVLARRREAEAGVMSLFGDGADDATAGEAGYDDARVPVPDVEFDKSQLLVFEKEMLGLYISDHPLMGAEATLAKHADCSLAELRELRDGEMRAVAGVVTSLQRRYTKRGDLMATFVLEDLEAAIEVMVFPRTMQEYGLQLADDTVVCIKGRLDLKDDDPKLICMELERIELASNSGSVPLRINLPASSLTEPLVTEIKRVLLEHRGPCPVFLHLSEKVLRLSEEFNVDCSSGLLAELRVLLGPTGIVT